LVDRWMDGWTDRQPGKEADRQILNREIDGGYIYTQQYSRHTKMAQQNPKLSICAEFYPVPAASVLIHRVK
jgi:hypothetical protein